MNGPVVLVLMLLFGAISSRSQVGQDSIHGFLRSDFHFTNQDCLAVDTGQIVTKSLKTECPAEFAVFGAVRLHVPLEFIVEQYRNVKMFKQNSAVPEIGTVSVPPRLDDFDALTLEEEDIRALQNCRSGDCKVKLPKAMMQRFHTEIDWNRSDFRSQVLVLTKAMLTEFVESYLAEGNGALGQYDDQVPPLNKVSEYQEILREKPNLFLYDSALLQYLDQYPNAPLPRAEDFIYWQKQTFEKIKPVLSLNHLTICLPDSGRSHALVASQQIYANHYFESSLAITALVKDNTRAGVYVLYLNRSRFDDLRKKGIVDMRPKLRDELYRQVQDELRLAKERLESLYQLQKQKHN